MTIKLEKPSETPAMHFFIGLALVTAGFSIAFVMFCFGMFLLRA